MMAGLYKKLINKINDFSNIELKYMGEVYNKSFYYPYYYNELYYNEQEPD